MLGGLAGAIVVVVLGAFAPSAAAQDRYVVEDPCWDSGRLASVNGDALHVHIGDLFLRHDLRRVDVAGVAGGFEARLSLCAPPRGSDGRGGVRELRTTVGTCAAVVQVREPLDPAAPVAGTSLLEPWLTADCGSSQHELRLPASSLAVEGAEVRLRLTRDVAGLPRPVRDGLAAGATVSDLGGYARPMEADELGVFSGDVRLGLSPTGGPDVAGGDGRIVLG